MGLDNYSREELQELSMINLATMILEKENKAMPYQEIYDQVVTLKNYNDVEKQEFLAQFYTDLNIDGRLLSIGSGLWGLRDWYPVEQIEEEISAAPKKKKKKKAAAKKKKKKEAIFEDTDEDITEEDLDFDQTDFDESDDDFDEVSKDDDDFDEFDDEELDTDDDDSDDDTEDDEDENK
ncbi:hypothetical protein GCM10011351_18560 [Paraliobacillus quinghaiensis]|uniref:Probable DNA-directed RNA polymerase subunit delta n=1 Tax=Paraliobacillus quinghaiensis TaxID=470815 RepID=A0A917TQK7_9BACI|nr:DNA-directed RNA polymerase subunit delta [Paraliobacillus quinghaiensis]GGM32814.1 hypothetical protein GCM10011351_18560 [Paraliobacillus quinghaiensis]